MITRVQQYYFIISGLKESVKELGGKVCENTEKLTTLTEQQSSTTAALAVQDTSIATALESLGRDMLVRQEQKFGGKYLLLYLQFYMMFQ